MSTPQEQILEALEDGVIAIGPRGRINYLNDRAEQLTGTSRASGVGQQAREIFARDPWIQDLLERGVGGQATTAEGVLHAGWGDVRPVRVSLSPIIEPDGRLGGHVLLVHDMTLQRGLENELARAQRLEEFGTLVTGLAHEIKNPLSGIRGAMQLLGRQIDDGDEGHEYVELVVREVDRLAGLLKQLLSLGSQRPLDRRPLNVHRALDHVLALCEESARAKGTRLVRQYDPSLPDLLADEDALVQVFLNLVQNALQALESLPEGATREVRIRTRAALRSATSRSTRRGRSISVEIEDSGRGIPAEVQPQIFAPFVTTRAKGTGLGLAISQRIVIDHGGRISFDSEPGRTCFRVLLPVPSTKGSSLS